MRVRVTVDDDFLSKYYWIKSNTVWNVLRVSERNGKKKYQIQCVNHNVNTNDYMKPTAVWIDESQCEVVEYPTNSKYYEGELFPILKAIGFK